jgi:hypothetical protein
MMSEVVSLRTRTRDRVKILLAITMYAGVFVYLVSTYGIDTLTLISAGLLMLFVVVGKLLW